jgi:hypothetical protein
MLLVAVPVRAVRAQRLELAHRVRGNADWLRVWRLEEAEPHLPAVALQCVAHLTGEVPSVPQIWLSTLIPVAASKSFELFYLIRTGRLDIFTSL